jgi:hypothetical protein
MGGRRTGYERGVSGLALFMTATTLVVDAGQTA